MIIHGKERNFKMTVAASAAIADLCPDGDISRLDELLNNLRYSDKMMLMAKISVILNRGYEDAAKYENPGYAVDYLCENELLSLGTKEFMDVQTSALSAISSDTQTTVEVDTKKDMDSEA